MDRCVSIFDHNEDDYHGFLTGILSEDEEWKVESNLEAGDGRFDIRLTYEDQTLIILECKKSETLGRMEKDAQKGAGQIVEKRYLVNEKSEDFPNRIGYGISFYGKKCQVKKV